MAEPTQTHCPYCSLLCGITLHPAGDGILELTGREYLAVNHGGLCMKGANAIVVDPRSTAGFEAVRRAVGSNWPDRTERISGFGVGELTATVHALATAAPR